MWTKRGERLVEGRRKCEKLYSGKGGEGGLTLETLKAKHWKGRMGVGGGCACTKQILRPKTFRDGGGEGEEVAVQGREMLKPALEEKDFVGVRETVQGREAPRLKKKQEGRALWGCSVQWEGQHGVGEIVQAERHLDPEDWGLGMGCTVGWITWWV